MQKAIFDIETDGLLDTVSRVWCLVVRNIEQPDDVRVFTEDNLREGLALLDSCQVIAGHNVIGYDLVVLSKLYNWSPAKGVRVWDTWIMSQTLQYKRSHRHSLKGWGEFLGEQKSEFKDFEQFSDEMVKYCVQDTMVNLKVYNKLVSDVRQIIPKNRLISEGLRVEMEFAKLEAEIQHTGWSFDMAAAEELKMQIEDRMSVIEKLIEPKIGIQKVWKDKVAKACKYKKDGSLFLATAKDLEGSFEWEVEGKTYRRFSMEPPSLGSLEVVKAYLYSIGWEPDEFNVEKLPNGQFINKSPKLTDSSLEKIEDGPLIIEYLGIRNRLGVLNGWMEGAAKDGRLHGRMWTIGTPTFRCRHEVIANLPGVDALMGKSMRGLLKADPGKVLVGADSSGNQMRGLCHYMGNADFTNEVVNGDVHQRNADILGIPRKTAKSFLYAFLFGAGPAKLAQTAIGKRDAKTGKLMQEKFYDNTPGLAEIRDKLKSEWGSSYARFGKEYAYISGIDGRMIFVESEHQLLNYLLQTLEGITCKAAAVYLKEKLVEAGIEHKFLLHYHDELAVQVNPEDAERVRLMAEEAFIEAPKKFGVMCMGGAGQIGHVYADIH